MSNPGRFVASIASAALDHYFRASPIWTDAIRSDVPSGDDAAAPEPGARLLLIVDDEDLLRAAVRRYFGRHGWAVLEAGDGDEALALLSVAARRPDVVIADRGMPRLDGIALHEALAATAPALAARFVLASGDPGAEELAAFRTRTGCAVVGKPLPLSELVAIATRVADAADAADGAHAPG